MSDTNTTINIVDSYPLSPMQQAMLFHYQLSSDSGIYIQQLIGSFGEELNIDAFREAWLRVLARHDILRTAFRWEGLDEPLQDVYSHADIPLEILDWQGLSAEEQQTRLDEFIKSDQTKGFDLTRPPLIRLTVFKLGPGNYRFIWTYHHILVDGRSRQVIIDEVITVYDSICQSEDYDLQETRPYHDYIDWIQQQDASKTEEFWRDQLKGFHTPNSIISQKPGSLLSENEREKAECEISISPAVTSQLRSIAKKNRLTLNIIIQGAWALLLSRYSSEDDVVFGEVRAGRHWVASAERASMVGLFIHTVPIRLQIAPEKSLLEWFREIRQLQWEMRKYEATPLVDIQQWSEVPRDKSLFESLYVYYDMDTFFWGKDGRWANRDFYLLEDNGFPITVDVYAGSELSIKITYDGRQFTDSAVSDMLGHLKTLLESIAENIDRPPTALPMLTKAERQKITVDWNDTRVDYPQDKLIHQIFEARVEENPDRVALFFEGKEITYRELNERANQLAHYLQSIGVGAESIVGIAMERSIEMIVGLYGILKAGAAYLPVEPTYPPDRIAYMLQDADISVLLTQSGLLDKFPSQKAKVICLDMDWPVISTGISAENPVCSASLDNLAYVIYTSGSTGNPKGVMNTHRGILNRLLWMQDEYQLSETDRVLQKTPFSFDVSVWEFFWPLMFGASLVIARPEGHKDSDYLVNTIVEQEISTIHFVPSMLKIFLMAEGVEKCTSLRQVICSGEALSIDSQQHFFTRLEAKLHNLYGPTEAAVDVTYWECRPGEHREIVPIGRPVANTRIYILDKYLQPVPAGISGELCIGGVQVARGYLNRRELTDAAFVPDPFSDDPTARLYKTGDLARFLPDGNIEYLGRLDFQVKIRGNRVELGEIETVLKSHPDIRDAVVLLREDIPDDQRLAAYIIPTQQTSVTELRDYVRQNLPDFMVPSHFIMMDVFPLTPNQKIDRKALPIPDSLQIEPGNTFAPPRNELQQNIASLWQETLRIPEVGIDDNFFELGGHSLLIVKVYYQLQKQVERKLTIMDMFRFPTIRLLSDYLSKTGDEDTGSKAKVSAERALNRREAIMQRQQKKRRSV